MKRNSPKQLEFAGKLLGRPQDQFGGSLLKGNPKTRRPLDSKMPLHVVLRANQGGMRLPKVGGRVESELHRVAKKCGVKVYSFANVGNHLHAVLRVTKTRRWSAFIREFTSRIAELTTRVIGPLKTKFWKYRPFTRIVRGWKKAYRIVREYVRLNVLEAQGRISRAEIRTIAQLRVILDG